MLVPPLYARIPVTVIIIMKMIFDIIIHYPLSSIKSFSGFLCASRWLIELDPLLINCVAHSWLYMAASSRCFPVDRAENELLLSSPFINKVCFFNMHYSTILPMNRLPLQSTVICMLSLSRWLSYTIEDPTMHSLRRSLALHELSCNEVPPLVIKCHAHW